jgi:hypothetical protein
MQKSDWKSSLMPMTVEAFQAMPAAERKLQTTPWATAQILLKQARHT